MSSDIWVAIITGVFGLLGVILPQIFARKSTDERNLSSDAMQNNDAESSSTSKDTDRESNSMRRRFLWGGISVVVGLALASSAYVISVRILPSSCLPLAPTKVTITSPASESLVPPLVTFQGTVCHMSDDQQLWILVQPDNERAYYPKSGLPNVTSDDNWHASVPIGKDNPSNEGRGFTVLVVIADQQASTILQECITRGCLTLPKGIQAISQVHVVRK